MCAGQLAYIIHDNGLKLEVVEWIWQY